MFMKSRIASACRQSIDDECKPSQSLWLKVLQGFEQTVNEEPSGSVLSLFRAWSLRILFSTALTPKTQIVSTLHNFVKAWPQPVEAPAKSQRCDRVREHCTLYRERDSRLVKTLTPNDPEVQARPAALRKRISH